MYEVKVEDITCEFCGDKYGEHGKNGCLAFDDKTGAHCECDASYNLVELRFRYKQMTDERDNWKASFENEHKLWQQTEDKCFDLEADLGEALALKCFWRNYAAKVHADHDLPIAIEREQLTKKLEIAKTAIHNAIRLHHKDIYTILNAALEEINKDN